MYKIGYLTSLICQIHLFFYPLLILKVVLEDVAIEPTYQGGAYIVVAKRLLRVVPISDGELPPAHDR